MFVGWEGVGLCSYLLIGYWSRDREKADAGKKAFIVNRIGDVGFLVAMFLLFSTFGTVTSSVFPCRGSWITAGGLVDGDHALFLPGRSREERADAALSSGFPTPWRARRPCRRSSTRPRWSRQGVYLVARSSVALRAVALARGVVAGWGTHRALRGDHRAQAERHQEGPGVLDGLPARLHVHRGGRGARMPRACSTS